MEIILNISDENAKILEEGAKVSGIDIKSFTENLIKVSINQTIAATQMAILLELLQNEVLPRLINVEIGSVATRHQVTNLHCDILEDADRGLAIADEATAIARNIILGA